MLYSITDYLVFTPHLPEYKFVILHDRLDGLVADRGACIPGSPLPLHGEDVPEPALHHLVRSPAREVRSPADRGYNLRLMASEVGVVLSEELLALCLLAPTPCAQPETPALERRPSSQRGRAAIILSTTSVIPSRNTSRKPLSSSRPFYQGLPHGKP